MKVTNGLHAFIWRNPAANNCNTYFIDGSQKIIIDPGHQHLFDHVRKGLAGLNLSLNQIDVVLTTHGHPDHMEAVQQLEEPTLFAMSQAEHKFIKDIAGNYFKIPEPDFFLGEGDLTIGDTTFQVIVTPGHSPGSVCLYWPDRKALFTGDVVFSRSIGRTDLPGGSSSLLKESIKRISMLDVEYLLTGHGEIVAGVEAVRANFQMIENYWFKHLR
ncbi:MAG: MBL fold metallo-hydrolase [Proteobacteria bacterium]|nr:MBL fold metallo-hydrolase [Pseudomonadota bacterium]